MEPVFEIDQRVKVVHDMLGDYFLDSEGVIKDITYKEKENEFVYGLVVIKPGKNLSMYNETTIYYFVQGELELVRENDYEV